MAPRDPPLTPPLTDNELDRYARHIVLREIGGPGQRALRGASVLVVGAGGLGAPLLMYLAAAGVGRITIVDDDHVSLSNLQRQVLFGAKDIGAAKVEAAKDRLSDLNAGVEIVPVAARITAETAADFIAGQTLVLDGCDNFETRYAVNAACVAAGVPLISGAISQWEGQVSVFDPRNDAPCYACVFPKAPAEGLAPSCAEAGVLGALPGVIGSMMAVEAVKLITGAGAPLRGKMMIYDALWAENRVIGVKRREGCAVCANAARP